MQREANESSTHTHLYYTSSIIGIISLFALKNFWKFLSTGNFNFFLKVKFVILSKSSHNLSISSDMENKRMKFSPNLIAEVENRQLNYWWELKTGTLFQPNSGDALRPHRMLWCLLFLLLSTIQDHHVLDIGLNIPVFDCFLPPSIVTNAQQ